MTPIQREILAVVALGADAVNFARLTQRRAASLIARGETDLRLPALASLVVAEGPTCPTCRCNLIGTSPTKCTGCGARVAWHVEARLI